MICLNVKSALA